MNHQSDIFIDSQPIKLDCGKQLRYQLSYDTYGTLNPNKTNAILICHALTGDQYVASTNPVTQKSGWWANLVGPGLPIDTDKYFVICANVLGGCLGSTGPASQNPDTGKIYGLDFPVVTVFDMVRAQARLIDHFNIDRLFSVIGGSMGGMLVLEWAASYKSRILSAIPIATGSRHSSQNIAFHEVGRQAIMADPNWQSGNYHSLNTSPAKGLAVARMAAHITYMSDQSLQQKFGRNLQDRDSISFGFDADFQIESYLRHQGMSFVDRFDANSYLYLTRAMDYFDLAAKFDDSLMSAFIDTDIRFCIISFTSDWLFPPEESKLIAQALNRVAANVSYVEVNSPKGHDAFLLDEPEMFSAVSGFLTSTAQKYNICDKGENL
ncbi:MAG: homoserine O-acetyltransferase [Rhizobiales bacterium]|nr:homoserine O-acetyltransferase [Hyphomicrobiales bacterium]NRB14706.1 homoserine O-acetyltransferase [Hyphomicrobiales bacterium]